MREPVEKTIAATTGHGTYRVGDTVIVMTQKRRKPRTVEVIEDRLYDVITKVVDGRGKDLNLQIPRKQLIDPSKWTPLSSK